MTDIDRVTAALPEAIARHLGPPGDVLGLTRLTGGATKATWSFDAVVGGARLPLVLQQASPRQTAPDDPMSRLPHVYGACEAALLAAAAARGVPVAPARAVLDDADALGPGLISDRVDGETLGRRVARGPELASVRPHLAARCGAILGALHGVDPAGVPGLVAQGAREQLQLYRDVVACFGEPFPAIELGLAWVDEHLPNDVPLEVVHGDFRNGNLVVGPDGIRAVLDWEIAHLGDPMEDLGWLCVRTWRFGGREPVGGFGRREDLFAAWEGATGRRVDAERVRFWEAFGCVKWGVMCLMKGLAHRRGAEPTVEALAIGRRSDEPLWDFLALAYGARPAGAIA